MTQAPQHNFGTPSHNWADGSGKKRDGTSWVPAMLVGALIFGVGCGSGLVVGWFGGTVSGIGEAFADFDLGPAEITIKHDAPQTAVVGEPITITFSVADISGSPRMIRDIDWSGTIADNMQFGTITPTPVNESPDEGYRETVFDTPLGANQSMDFTFVLTPRQAGIYSAEVTVFVDDYNSEWTNITIDVRDATAEPNEDDS